MQKIVRYTFQNSRYWGVVKDESIYRLPLKCASTRSLLSLTRNQLYAEIAQTQQLENDEITLLSPITSDAKILCQGANYRQHMIESGLDPDAKNFNMMFTKSSASITAPQGSIIRPAHVKLLDYEIELSLVIGTNICSSTLITQRDLSQYIAGICIGNDVSARDIQIPQMQFHKGKSYRTFCPLGPFLVLLEPDEFSLLDDLTLELKVNGEIRQRDNTRNLVFKPAETLSEFSQVADMFPGDVVMTGTPAGCALGLPAPFIVKLTGLLPDKKRWALFNQIQHKRSQYLKPGDIVESRIYSTSHPLSLGVQRHVIEEGKP